MNKISVANPQHFLTLSIFVSPPPFKKGIERKEKVISKCLLNRFFRLSMSFGCCFCERVSKVRGEKLTSMNHSASEIDLKVNETVTNKQWCLFSISIKTLPYSFFYCFFFFLYSTQFSRQIYAHLISLFFALRLHSLLSMYDGDDIRREWLDELFII